VRRPTVFTLLLLAVLGLAVALDSAVLGIVAVLMLLAVTMEALGDDEGGVLATDSASPRRAAERKRTALGRMRRRRTWDRRAPDHADEPPDVIWSREAQRRRGAWREAQRRRGA
jgi:hypothetical protein